MRIDGRFDPKLWVTPPPDDVVVSTKVEVKSEEPSIDFSGSDEAETELAFAGEMQNSYAYTYAYRTAANVTKALDGTPDL